MFSSQAYECLHGYGLAQAASRSVVSLHFSESLLFSPLVSCMTCMLETRCEAAEEDAECESPSNRPPATLVRTLLLGRDGGPSVDMN